MMPAKKTVKKAGRVAAKPTLSVAAKTVIKVVPMNQPSLNNVPPVPVDDKKPLLPPRDKFNTAYLKVKKHDPL